MISTINQAHPIFQKDWQKPKVAAASSLAGSTMVPAFADFFQGLPMEQPTKRAGKINFVSKQQLQAQRVQRLQDQLQKAQVKMAEVEEEAKDQHSSSRMVTAFNANPMQSVHSASNSRHHVGIERVVSRPSHHSGTNVIGNAEDQEEEDEEPNA